MRCRYLLPTWIAAAVALTGAAQTHIVAAPPAGLFHGCPAEGLNGDPILNALKNRVTAPNSPRISTISDLVALKPPSVLTGLERSKWRDVDRQLAAAHEGDGVVLTGFVVYQQKEGRGIANCNDRFTDLRVFLGASADALKSAAVVGVATPRWQEVNPEWTEANLAVLAEKHAQVRITGWLLFADDRADELLHDHRATLWEIHPITRIEVEEAGQWHDLAREASAR